MWQQEPRITTVAVSGTWHGGRLAGGGRREKPDEGRPGTQAFPRQRGRGVALVSVSRRRVQAGAWCMTWPLVARGLVWSSPGVGMRRAQARSSDPRHVFLLGPSSVISEQEPVF